jgi:antitoxin (DNA-binding transcriptional repressor) of toxin-antitoxin stability system
MKTATVRDIRHDFARVLTWIEDGEHVEITKSKRVVARLVPVKAKHRRVDWPDLAARRKKIFPASVKGKPVSEIIDEGRGKSLRE